MFWLGLLSVTALATSRFERRYGTFATIGLERPVTRRLDEVLTRDPYFEDLARELQGAFEARTTRALDAFTCAGSLTTPAEFLKSVGATRERVIEVLGVASYLEPGDDDVGPLTERLIRALGGGASLSGLLARLDRFGESLPLGELTAEIDRVLGTVRPRRAAAAAESRQ